jgi:hypothetical protein
MGLAGRRRVTTHFTFAAMAEGYLCLFRALTQPGLPVHRTPGAYATRLANVTRVSDYDAR